MPCLVLILILAFPRVVLVLMLLLSTYIERAYHGLIIPLLGFIFLPLTTIVYALMVNNGLPIADSYLVVSENLGCRLFSTIFGIEWKPRAATVRLWQT
jgi:hypothetical protein